MEATEIIIAGLKYWPQVLAAILSFFILRMIKGWDDSIKDTNSRVCKLEKSNALSAKTIQAAEMILTEWALIKKSISDAEAKLTLASDKLDQIIVLKRDRDSAFRRIDELRDEIREVEKMSVDRCHTIQNRVTAIRSALDAHHINVNFD